MSTVMPGSRDPVVKQLDVAIALREFSLVMLRGVYLLLIFQPVICFLFLTVSQNPVEKQFAGEVLSCDYSTEKFFS